MTTRHCSAKDRHPGGRSAFSLIELVAVTLVVGILSGVAVVAVSNATGTRPSLAATQLLRDLTYVRQRAMATGIRSWVVVNTGAEMWTVLVEDPASPGFAGATIPNDPAMHQPFVVSLSDHFPGVDIVSANFDTTLTIGFDWQGQPWSYNGTENVLVADGTVTFNGGHIVVVKAKTGHILYTPP